MLPVCDFTLCIVEIQELFRHPHELETNADTKVSTNIQSRSTASLKLTHNLRLFPMNFFSLEV